MGWPNKKSEPLVSHVLVSLTEVPLIGDKKMLVLIQDHNRDIITHAAQLVGMSQQNFMRTVLVSAAKKVIKEIGT